MWRGLSRSTSSRATSSAHRAGRHHPDASAELHDDLASAVRGAWLVVEADPEKLGLTKQMFGELDSVADDVSSSVVSMRAGGYATFGGVDYPSSPLDGARLRLFAAKTGSAPPGFEDSMGLRWTRLVDSSEVTGQYLVLTSALWRGLRVEVGRVIGESALIDLHDPTAHHDHRPILLPWTNGRWAGSVPVDSLSGVEEIFLEAPAGPPQEGTGVRAGMYATFDGVDYPCVHTGRSRLRLYAAGPPPPGFEKATGPRWTRLVDSSEATGLYLVRTIAVWRGREVNVERVLGDQAEIELYDPGYRFPGRPELVLEQHGRWSGSVPVSSLADLEQKIIEILP